MREVALGVIGAAEALVAEKKLTIELDVPVDPPKDRGDERRITQVLMNLAGSSITCSWRGRS